MREVKRTRDYGLNFEHSKFKVKKVPKPERGWATSKLRKHSLLQTEVEADDIADPGEDYWGGSLSLSDEIAKIEAKRAADGIPPLAPMISVFEDYYNRGDVTELGIYEHSTHLSREQQTILFILEDNAVRDANEKSTAKSNFVPPHQKHYQRLREKAEDEIHDTSHPTSKLMASEAASLVRCCAAPLM